VLLGFIDGCNDWQKEVTEGAKDKENRGVEIQSGVETYSEMQDVQI
jgi:hypothetical protein